jgi:hypothetical protein
VRTGFPTSQRGRMDGAGVGQRGRALRVRVSAQVHHPGGVAAKVSGRGGPNPDRNQPSGKRGTIGRAQSAQAHKPGGVTAKI